MSTDGRFPKNFRAWLEMAASPAILFYALPWLMILLVAGTVAQKDLGLYAAQHLYFSSWILWWGPFPLPGAYLTLGVITLCLAAKFVLYSPWRVHQAGIILTHLGVLVLLIGGLITAFSQKEGYMLLGEGQSSALVSDYHERVLSIAQGGKTVAGVPFATLKAGETVSAPLPFTIMPRTICRNCQPAPVKNPDGRHGLAREISLRSAPPDQSDEANLSGLSFAIAGAGEQDGEYLVMEEIPHHPQIRIGEEIYTISLSRAQTALPFAIELKNFERVLHPGTDMASGFSSDVIVRDGAVEWPYLIRMNEPLRYKGYTFYQASFSLRPDGEYSVLSVVRNKGRIFPYLGGALIFAGLLLHIFIRLTEMKRKAA
jgi:hypothetical protein